MARRSWTWCVLAVPVLLGALSAQVVRQGPTPEAKARIEAFVAALSSESPDAFEALAQKEFSPELLAKRTPADRRRMHAQLRKELGATSVERVRRENDTLTIVLRGATGLVARVELDVAPQSPHRYTRMAVAITDGPEPDEIGPSVDVRGSMPPAELVATLDHHVAKAAGDGFSGVVLVARDGVPVFEKAYGLANRTFEAPNTPATRFNLASIGKAFTKTAIGQLVAAGTLRLTDTLGTLLPDYPQEQTRAATVAQLLEHQGGIADFFGRAFAERSMAEFRSNADYYRYVSGQPPLFAPGAERRYCNGCYVVLGAIIERLSGKTYERYVAEHVFDRAGMSGAGFFRADEPAPNVATGYTRNLPGAGGSLRSNVFAHGAAGSAAGGSCATAADLVAFDNALRTGRLLDPKMTAWFLGAEPAAAGRARGSFQIAGGAPGTSTVLESDGTWTVVVVANVDPPAAVRLAGPIMRALAS